MTHSGLLMQSRLREIDVSPMVKFRSAHIALCARKLSIQREREREREALRYVTTVREARAWTGCN